MIINNGNYCVYSHTNKINGKKYIGITCQEPIKRWNNRNGYNPYGKSKSRFYNAIQKYGWNNFDHEIIASNLTREEANNFEHVLITTLKTNNSDYGYNITSGGDGVARVKHAEETKVKMSKARKEWYNNHPDYKAPKKTPKEAEEYRKKQRMSHLGKKTSEETKKLLSEIGKGRQCLWAKKQIINLDTGEIFDSITSAALKYKCCPESISMSIKRNGKSCGFHWNYCGESEGKI